MRGSPYETCGPSGKRETLVIAQIGESETVRNSPQLIQGRLVELTGFEPVTPSLRKMWSKRCYQATRRASVVLWGGCGPRDVRPGETW